MATEPGLTGSGETRISYTYFLLNKHALPLFMDVSVYRHARLPNHSPCILTLDAAPFSAKVLYAKPHVKWKLPPKPASKQQCLQSYVGELAQAAEDLNVEQVWDVACRSATSMLTCISDQVVPSTRGQLLEKLSRFVSGAHPNMSVHANMF